MGTGDGGRRYLIVNADDFGMSPEVNEAVERAHRQGILTSTSLMVGELAAQDAVERARRMPDLAVGLHLTLSSGRAVLAPEKIPSLVDSRGRLSAALLKCGVRYALDPRARRQLALEIEAQFAAFADTGLRLDHVNAHNHLHLHPSVLTLLLTIGRRFGVAAVRVPGEAGFRSLGLSPWLALLRRRLRSAAVRYNDHFFGLHDSGRMTSQRVLGLLQRLPAGVSEMMFHPAMRPWDDVEPGARAFAFRSELDALIDANVQAAVHAHGIELTSFGRLRHT